MSKPSLHIVFAHANSFALPTYRVLFKLLAARGIEARGPQMLGHDPEFPVSNNWPHLVEQLARFTEAEVQRLGQPVFLVGHSLGGLLSVMLAARRPELARGVLMLDSPLIGGWKANAFDIAKRTQLAGTISPGKISQRRRKTWPSEAEAMAYFQSKPAFASWRPQMLQDYVRSGLTDDGHGQRTLLFTREVETAIYNSFPSNFSSLLRRHPLQSPVAFIGALASREIGQIGLELTRRVTQGRMTMLDGSHLFPMEQPEVAAAAMEAALLNLQTLQKE